jgi:hypothetical protein
MGIVELLDEARTAGLTVEACGDRLRIQGPKRAEPLALQLLKVKSDVLAELARSTAPSTDATSRDRTARDAATAGDGAPAPGKSGYEPVYLGNVTIKGQVLEVHRQGAMLFSRRPGLADLVCCGRELREAIEQQLAARAPGAGQPGI